MVTSCSDPEWWVVGVLGVCCVGGFVVWCGGVCVVELGLQVRFERKCTIVVLQGVRFVANPSDEMVTSWSDPEPETLDQPTVWSTGPFGDASCTIVVLQGLMFVANPSGEMVTSWSDPEPETLETPSWRDEEFSPINSSDLTLLQDPLLLLSLGQVTAGHFDKKCNNNSDSRVVRLVGTANTAPTAPTAHATLPGRAQAILLLTGSGFSPSSQSYGVTALFQYLCRPLLKHCGYHTELCISAPLVNLAPSKGVDTPPSEGFSTLFRLSRHRQTRTQLKVVQLCVVFYTFFEYHPSQCRRLNSTTNFPGTI
ncbi:hypothetical protein J6590_007712 [Homalodisca vitripennis]|nr:hypothetical protein J6590_007712 [Homalodisca vitripennis]